MVHLENRVTTHRRMDAAEPLTLEVTAGDLRPHRRGRTLDVRLEASVGGELVWACDSVYLSPGRGEAGRARGRGAARRCPAARRSPAGGSPRTSVAGTPASPATSTPSTCTRSRRAPSG